MAHESFEDEEVAAILNEKYISIKVDREERPDIDSVYMRVCQMLTGHGGWPLSVFLTPEGKPFYAGTYFPKRSRYGQPGFIDVLTKLYHKYQENPNEIEQMAEQITEALRQSVRTAGTERLSLEAVEKAYRQLAGSFDTVYGGFGGAPKFPIPHMLMFLLRYAQWKRDDRALLMVEKTLNGMANGGIYDHIGYGFARYSTDAMWLVPHFEKMLYDNALLVIAYTETYQRTKNERYKEIAEQIIEFVKREMMAKDGAFYSAIDADSEGVEGKYYVWTPAEVIDVLGAELGELYCKVYDITEEGNFEGKNVPNLIHTRIDRIAKRYGMAEEELQEKLEQAREKLFAARSSRVYPHVDDKILTAWNALMIAALAKAAKVYERRDYLDMAERALSFLEANLVKDGRLMVRYRDGEAKHLGIIDDYAYLVWAYIEMYEATFNLSYLQTAKIYMKQALDLFWDNEHGGFFTTGKDAEALIVREKEIYDGALPSGNSVAAVQLIRLGRLTGDLTLLEKAEKMYQVFKRPVEAYESGHTFFLQGLLLLETPTVEVVLFGKQGDEKREQLIQKWQHSLAPNVFLLAAEHPADVAHIAPFAAEYEPLGEETTVYVCENFACRQPTTDVESVAEQLF
ncbi:hypothetical protein H839_07999 [Parageobacillus genomosp. 1]|uniref:Spermatogenesis-associated protein 20-like TRX domain-containing protein n=1 Tax=Parageobacillus genomosp. 1 TaxID=1295642 RepID=A0ABC9VGK9_9BACL|nr:thioredoxin domain-containing protein [Parageobacillus genomosp. 1]EZP77559.1 hypothetical protein H839_07999 [Parageobacillus genomosp. 1]